VKAVGLETIPRIQPRSAAMRRPIGQGIAKLAVLKRRTTWHILTITELLFESNGRIPFPAPLQQLDYWNRTPRTRRRRLV
jgi:hypothetical protein